MVSRLIRRETSWAIEAISSPVTLDIADELRRRYVEFGEVPDRILDFMEAIGLDASAPD